MYAMVWIRGTVRGDLSIGIRGTYKELQLVTGTHRYNCFQKTPEKMFKKNKLNNTVMAVNENNNRHSKEVHTNYHWRKEELEKIREMLT